AREHRGRLDREIGAIRREPRDVDGARERHREVICRAGAHVFVERDGLVRGGDVVISIVEQGPHFQEHIDLPGCSRVHHLWSGRGGHETNLVDHFGQSLLVRTGYRDEVVYRKLLTPCCRRDARLLHDHGCRGTAPEHTGERL